MRKKILIAVGVIVVAIAAFSLYMVHTVGQFEKKMEATVVENVDITDVKDGSYEGVYDLKIVSAHVTVHVADGRVNGIEIHKHNHGPGYGAEAIVDSIIDQQSLDIDAVSGATGSSVIIRKAVELALRKGLGRKAAIGDSEPDATQEIPQKTD